MKKNRNVSLIIVNYNSSDFIKKLVKSLGVISPHLNLDIIIIDNNSTNIDIEDIINIDRRIRLFKLKENVGFSKASNFGVEKSIGENLVFVNPDVMFIEDCISPIIEFIEKYDNVGACGPTLLYEDSTIQNSTGFKMGVLYDFLEAFFLIDIFRKFYGVKLNRASKRMQPCNVGWLSAALLIVKKQVFVKVGGFDSRFFLNYEDIDLCRTLQKNDYKNYHFPFLKCIHYAQHSFKHDYELLVYSRYFSRKYYARKHYSALKLLFVSLFHLIGLLIRLITVNFYFSGKERIQRYNGYKRAIKLYI